LEPTKVECFEDETLAEAKRLMLDAKVTEIAVVRHAKLLVGTTNLEAIARQPDGVSAVPPNDSGD
jgi:CBS domain-containing protein